MFGEWRVETGRREPILLGHHEALVIKQGPGSRVSQSRCKIMVLENEGLQHEGDV